MRLVIVEDEKHSLFNHFYNTPAKLNKWLFNGLVHHV